MYELVIAVILTVFVFVLIRFNAKAMKVIESVLIAIFDLSRFVGSVSDVLVFLLYKIGKIMVVAMFLISLTALVNNICISYGVELLKLNSDLYPLIAIVSKDSDAWIASTAVLAATIAFGHFQNLDINIKKHNDEMYDRIKNRKSE